jgi:dolichol-phosphate mannosyltransferase
MEKRALIIIPTYNEKGNVQGIVDLVLRQSPSIDLLIVDDNSPDGTGNIVEDMSRQQPRLHLLRRAGKLGLGTAYIAGFKWGLEKGYDYLMEMDADFSHDPNELSNFLKKIEEADLVLGSRYCNGIRVINWPLSRLMLSKGAACYVRLITGMPVTDPTGGFKCFRREVLEALELEKVRSNGYAFQVEMTYNAWMKGFRVAEIPITFAERYAGQSKMSGQIVREALWMVWFLALCHGFRRSPPKTHPRSIR